MNKKSCKWFLVAAVAAAVAAGTTIAVLVLRATRRALCGCNEDFECDWSDDDCHCGCGCGGAESEKEAPAEEGSTEE